MNATHRKRRGILVESLHTICVLVVVVRVSNLHKMEFANGLPLRKCVLMRKSRLNGFEGEENEGVELELG